MIRSKDDFSRAVNELGFSRLDGLMREVISNFDMLCSRLNHIILYNFDAGLSVIIKWS
jgi:hypothetical protein